MSVAVAVFASGGGSNFQSIIDHPSSADAVDVRLLISDRPDAGALDRARTAGIASRVIPAKGRPSEDVANETLAVLAEAEIRVLLLAGYLRLIPAEVIRAFPRRILNIHPALLPAFGGRGMWGHHVHEAVLSSGATVSGPTIHYVDEEYDTGSILAQWPVPVHKDDTPDTLAARVLGVEHILYPLAAQHLCRAVEKGIPAARLSPAGAAFQIGSGFDALALEREISRSFASAEAR